MPRRLVAKIEKGSGFNSLFVGMCFAILVQPDRKESRVQSFNSLFVGMCFAIYDLHFLWQEDRQFQFPFRRDVLCNGTCCPEPSCDHRSFNSLFVGMCFAISQVARYPRHRQSFNSLFVGMCFAMIDAAVLAALGQEFQFPFRRDVLCNYRTRASWSPSTTTFQFPFRRDVLCNAEDSRIRELEARFCFNSLFVGMCFAMVAAESELLGVYSFNSLFVGMCFAMAIKLIKLNGIMSFNSLFVGMCFAISLPLATMIGTRCFNSLFVGMCFAMAGFKESHGTPESFQFPFRRDVLCNLVVVVMSARLNSLFQFPFRRDVLCNNCTTARAHIRMHVSIPFSSGCALQFQGIQTSGLGRYGVSIPFSSGCALQSLCAPLAKPLASVSIPFSSGCALQ